MTRLPLHVEGAAEAEAQEIADYLEGDEPGLGTRFLVALSDTLDRRETRDPKAWRDRLE